MQSVVMPPRSTEPFATFGSARAARKAPPGARASRPQPYFWLEVTERQREVAGRQRAFRSEPHGQDPRRPPRSYGSNEVAEMAEAVPDMVRAGRPRSRVGILHTTNREHGLHPARESGTVRLGPIDSFVCKVLYLEHFAWLGRSSPTDWMEGYAWVAKLVDAKDLKSFGGFPPYRFDSGPGHQLPSGNRRG